MFKALHCNPSPTRESFSMKKQTTAPFLIMLLFTVSCHDSLARNTITPAQPLSDGETLVSDGGTFSLGFFTPPTSTGRRYVGIWYHIISIQTIVWVANRQNPITGHTGVLRLTVNGTLVINANNNSDVALWSSTPTSLTNPIATLLDTANFIVQEVNSAGDPNSFAWQSFDYPTDTLLPGMKLGWNLTSKLNRNLTSWKSDADPSIGNYTVDMDIHGVPQISLLSDSGQKWRTGPWNGMEFTAIPEMENYTDFTFTFVNNNDAVYYSYDTSNKSLITRLVVNNTGTAQRYVWLEDSDSWSVFWYAPHAQCESYSTCGAFGVCNPNASPICSCLQGFEPTSPANWALRDTSRGCERKTPLDCRNGTDSFVKVSNAQLPDTSNATVDMNAGLAECRVRCLMNCSCTAYANADVRSGGSGCIIWFDELVNLGVFVDVGQDLYVRLAAADIASSSTSEQSNKRNLRAIASACLTFGLLLCAFGAWLIWRRREREEDVSSFHELPLFDFTALVAATNDFSFGNKLGEGGFGPVYKGKTSEGQEIAVKRLAKTSLQGNDEFKNEVTLIAKLQHRNLVQLLGCCIQGEERMLVYEYMPNNSLDLFLFDKAKSSLLDWEMRYQIINGIARGLLYLHQDSRFRIVHRDLKASNILLDRIMIPKISDFGMARIFGGDETMSKTQKVVGTYGYMSPEYAMDGIFSVKSDIFSFGVLILEIISGQKNKGVYLSDPHLYLLGNAWRLWNKGKCLELFDPTIGHSSVAEVMRCIKVGLLCVQEFPEDRPTISSVVLMLGSDDAAAVPEPKQPGFVASRVYHEQFSDEQELHSVNDVTISITSGR